jgi:hypothetical protein
VEDDADHYEEREPGPGLGEVGHHRTYCGRNRTPTA